MKSFKKSWVLASALALLSLPFAFAGVEASSQAKGQGQGQGQGAQVGDLSQEQQQGQDSSQNQEMSQNQQQKYYMNSQTGQVVQYQRDGSLLPVDLVDLDDVYDNRSSSDHVRVTTMNGHGIHSRVYRGSGSFHMSRGGWGNYWRGWFRPRVPYAPYYPYHPVYPYCDSYLDPYCY